ncbi:MAG: hypothetical protein QXR31_05805, partial [Zestosphaera sp.]
MQNFIAREWEERFDNFAKAEPVGGENFICAGVFYNSYEPYLRSMANMMHQFINKKAKYEEFETFLRKKEYVVSGTAIYSRSVVNRWRKPFRLLKDMQKALSFYRHSDTKRVYIQELRIANPSDIEKRSGVVFLKVRGYEDVELSRDVEWSMRKDLMYAWMELSSSEEVKQYLIEVENTIRLLEEFYAEPWNIYAFRRVFFYLLP